MRINFVTAADERFASYRYRILIPARHLPGKHEVIIGGFVEADVHVFSKHFDYEDQQRARRCSRVVFDMCDNHFSTAHEAHYRSMIDAAGTITCPTAAMCEVVKLETGREAVLIEDPYELPEVAASLQQVRRLLWFGHSANIGGILAELPRLAGYETELVTDGVQDITHTAWSLPNLLSAMARSDLVIIPVIRDERTPVKSANRAVESIRQGKYVIANPLPAYADLGIWQGDILEGVTWAARHPDEANALTLKAQALVNQRFDPSKIGREWEKLLLSA